MMDPQTLARTVTLLERHRAALTALPGVVDAEVVRAADGQPAIVAYCETQQDAERYGGVKVQLASGNRVRFRVGER